MDPRQSSDKQTVAGHSDSRKKFVDLVSNDVSDQPSDAHQSVTIDQLGMLDAADLQDPYLKELLDVLDRVENEGEPYLEKLIVQAGLELSSPSEAESDKKRQKDDKYSRLRLARSKGHVRKDSPRQTKLGRVQPASEDNYRGLYGTYEEAGGTISPEETPTDSSTTSTESLVESLAEMIAKGEPPIVKPDAELTTYGTRIIPYGSFVGGETDAGLTKPTKSDALLRSTKPGDALDLDDEETEAAHEAECVEVDSTPSVTSIQESEDYYDEGKLGVEDAGETAPEMVLVAPSDDEDLPPPPHYYEYTQKESQCLAIVSNFRRQFTDAYPDRKPLFLTPVNEVGVPRFVCTTIRPTIFSYHDLFQWDGIARFFAYQLEYIFLNPPDIPPTVVMSPSFVLRERQGNCFDYCFLLASVLIGVGYDAYIVVGYASAAICTGDESHRVCPCVPQEPLPTIIPQYEQDFDFADLHSEIACEVFKDTINRQRAARIKERNANIKGLAELLANEKERAGPQPDVDNEENPETDPYFHRRVHAWIVIVPGKRDIADAFFIEPLTGTAFPATHSEFYDIESIFNHRQYYVNMQPRPTGEQLLSWDVSDIQKWEPVFRETAADAGKGSASITDGTTDSEDLLATVGCKLFAEDIQGAPSQCQVAAWPFRGFEMPRPWSEPLVISRRRYLRYCKNGYRLHRYLKCDMEYYHQYERKDGLVNKFIIFSNRKKTHIMEVKELYENRRDRLKYRKHTIRDGILREYFAPGHTKAIRMHDVQIHSEKPPKFSELYRSINTYDVHENTLRMMTYYHQYRNDGLERLEQRSDGIHWFYRGRRDRLVERYISYGTQIDRSYAVEALKCKGDQRPVAVVREKFDRDPQCQDPDVDIYIREYHVGENKLLLVFQPGKDLVTSTQRRFILPDFSETPQAGSELPAGYLRMNEDVMMAVFRDQLKEEKRVPIDIWDEMVHHYKQSLNAIISVRRSEDDFHDEINQRIEEEQDPALWHSIYDIERHPRAAAVLRKTEQASIAPQPKKEESQPTFDPTTFDWAAPYMAAYGDNQIASVDDALAIRQAVLEDIKERLLYTANSLQKNHEDEFHKLQILNEKFRKAQVTGEVTPKEYTLYENEKSAIQFRMHLLERRQELLQYHGPAKLKRANEWLLRDPRFADWLRGMHLETREQVIDGDLRGKGKGTGKGKKEWKVDSDEGEVEVQSWEGTKDGGRSSSMGHKR
ncbi:dynein regulatory complex subunit 7-like [Paramacrobiotus metropolitanus]|uniref:dynein regulatory complex subunit 7-like n=1 Tax=Paramacrobiotus metropolitanus TaxID=2943436 RepID=UPI0024463E7B|nr:dynein regulatory complex subunit 7-like [Paramacrobiotus metropolitanus]